MYIGPTLTDVTRVSDNKVLMRESLINSVKEDVEKHRTLLDRFVDFFMLRNSVLNKYAARTEETINHFLQDIIDNHHNSVTEACGVDQWKVTFRNDNNDYEISYITRLEPDMANLADNLFRTMIDTGKALPPDTPPVPDTPSVEAFANPSDIKGTVWGWDSPYSVQLRSSSVGAFDDGVNCYCPPVKTLSSDDVVTIIRHCLNAGLSPVEAQIIEHSDKSVDIGVSKDKCHGAEARSFRSFRLKKDCPPRIELKEDSKSIKDVIGRVRPQNADVALVQSDISVAALCALLNGVKESFCLATKQPFGDDIVYMVTFDLGNGCTAGAAYRIADALCKVKPGDITKDLVNLDSLLASKSKNLTDPLIRSGLEIEQIFDNSPDYIIPNFKIGTQIQSLMGLLNTERTMNAVVGPQIGSPSHQTVTLTDTTGGEPPVILHNVSGRNASKGEGRGTLLINALLDACEEATTNSDGTEMYKNISTARLKESLVNALNNHKWLRSEVMIQQEKLPQSKST